LVDSGYGSLQGEGTKLQYDPQNVDDVDTLGTACGQPQSKVNQGSQDLVDNVDLFSSPPEKNILPTRELEVSPEVVHTVHKNAESIAESTIEESTPPVEPVHKMSTPSTAIQPNPVATDKVEGSVLPFKIGDCVLWDSCPGHVETFNPSLIQEIVGDCARLEYYAELFPLTKLRLLA